MDPYSIKNDRWEDEKERAQRGFWFDKARYEMTIVEAITSIGYAGAGRSDDVRAVAACALQSLNEIKRLNKEIERLRGGETEDRPIEYSDEHLNVSNYVNHSIGFPRNIRSDVEKSLLMLGRLRSQPGCNSWSKSTIHGSTKYIDIFLDLIKGLNAMLQHCYIRGFQDGRNTLGQIINGGLTIEDLNKETITGEPLNTD